MRIALLALLAGCYEPTLKDCTVSCSADTDCAHGQACAAGGWCAAEGTSCSALNQPVDAPPVTADGPPVVDAAMTTPDAATSNATLRVVINNKGQVNIPGVGTCTSTNNGNNAQTCNYNVAVGAKLTAMAMMAAGGKMFDKWDDPLCKTQGMSCMFTTLPFTYVEAQFQ